jgi:sugar phosphate isomerase/epimerase
MQLGVDSYSFHLRLGKHLDFTPAEPAHTRWFLEKVAELDCDGLQLDPAHIESTDEEYLSGIRDFARKHDLYVEFGSAGVDPIRLINDLKAAHFVGAAVLRTFLGYDPRLPKAERERRLAQAEQNLRQVAPYSQQFAVKIALENHVDVTTKELKELIWMVGSDWVGVCLDTTNNLFLGEDPMYTAKELAPYVFATHLKDCQMEPALAPQLVKPLALGQGNVPLAQIIAIVREGSGLERFTIEVPTEVGEADESDLLVREEQKVRQSILCARDELGIK